MSKKNLYDTCMRKRDVCWTNIGSPDLVQEQKLRGYLETRRHGSLFLSGYKKKQSAGAVEEFIGAITIRRCVGYEIYLVGMPGFIWKWKCGEYYVGRVGR